MIVLGQLTARAWNLKTKFGLIAISVGILCFAASLSLSHWFTTKEFERNYQEKAKLIWMHIIDDLEQYMIFGYPKEIVHTLNIYKNYDEVEEVRVFDSKGKEVFFTEQGPAESRVQEALHTERLTQFQKKIDGKPVTTYIIPIRNKLECYGCHGKSETFRGALLVSFTLEKPKQRLAQLNQKYFFLFTFFTIAGITTAIFALNRLFIKPLKKLQQGTEVIGKGDFNFQIPVETKDEIGELTQNFNHMATTLSTLFEEIENKNRQLRDHYDLVTRSQQDWQETFDSITDLICVIDRNFDIVKANLAFKEYFGLPQEGPVNRKCYEVIRTCAGSNCPHHSIGKISNQITDQLHDKKTGKIFQISLFPYHSPQGDLTTTVFIAKDVTERKEGELKLIMSERLASLGYMASALAHEIGNPLATINGCAEGLLKRVDKGHFDPDLFTRYLKIIEEEIARCRYITSSTLSFVRKPSLEKTEVATNEVLDKSLEMLNFQGRLLNVDIVRKYQEELPAVHVNENEFVQALLSILLNAIEAMQDRGTLTVETGMEENKVFIAIQDIGPGMSPEILERIFDPFFTTKSAKGGTGLGLAMADKLIKDNQGKIEVTSIEGKGTTFKIILPIEQSKS